MKDIPAFPLPVAYDPNVGECCASRAEGAHGITIRDYFAAKAMSSLCMELSNEQNAKDTKQTVKDMAELSYIIADAMMKAREQ